MPIQCPKTGCLIRASFQQWGLRFANAETSLQPSEDCFTGVLYLTDDPGLQIVDDPNSDPFVQGNTPTYIGASSVDEHWLPCTPTYDHLKLAFSKAETGFGQRVEGIYVGGVEDGESFADAFKRISACFQCFTIVTAVPVLSDDSLFVDTAASIELGEAARDWTSAAHLAAYFADTAQIPELVLTDNELATFTYQHGQSSDRNWVWVNSTGCQFQRDLNCDVVVVDGVEQQEQYNQYTALPAAMVAASWNTTNLNQLVTLWKSPTGALGYGEVQPFTVPDTSTQGEHVATDNERMNLTGYRPNSGKRLSATRHANAFFAPPIGSRPQIGEGLDASGKWFFDKWRTLNIVRSEALKAMDAYFNSGARGISQKDLLDFEKELALILNRYQGRNLFATYGGEDWVDRGYDPNLIRTQTAAWIITSENIDDIDQALLVNRVGVVWNICFKYNDPQHGLQILICNLGDLPPVAA